MLNVYLYTRNRPPNEHGQAVTEYALVITFVVLAVIATIALMGDALSDYYTKIASEVAALY